MKRPNKLRNLKGVTLRLALTLKIGGLKREWRKEHSSTYKNTKIWERKERGQDVNDTKFFIVMTNSHFKQYKIKTQSYTFFFKSAIIFVF